MAKNILTKQTLNHLGKHPVIIFFTIILAILGALQSITWVYDRFLKNADPYTFEKSIFHNIAPGNSFDYLKKFLGEPRKIEKSENGIEILLWNFKNITIGASLNKARDTIDTLAIYSINCDYEIEIPQIYFTLCKDKLVENDENIIWDSFLGAQNAGYVEQQQSGRFSRYYSNYYGADQGAIDLITYVEDNRQIFGKTEEKILDKDNVFMSKISQFRKTIVPNFVLLSVKDVPVKNVLWDYFTALSNFNFFND